MYIRMVTISANTHTHTQNVPILSVECFVITVIAYYVRTRRIRMRHLAFLFCIQEYTLLPLHKINDGIIQAIEYMVRFYMGK